MVSIVAGAVQQLVAVALEIGERIRDGTDHRARRDRGARELVEVAAILAHAPSGPAGGPAASGP